MRAERKWILLAEDEADLREIICERLTDHFDTKVNIVQAEDGLDASRRLPFQVFDCIITDLNMPRKGGNSFIDAARSSQLNEFTPIIVVTGNPEAQYENSNDYIYQLEKPIDFDRLIPLIETQFRLGKTNKRLNADLITGFVESLKVTHKEVAEDDLQMDKPQLKKPKEELKGLYHRWLKISLDGLVMTFVIGFGDDYVTAALEKFKKKSDNVANAEPLDMINFIGHRFFRHAIKQLNNPTHLRVQKSESLSPDKRGNLKTLDMTKGISMPLETSLGEIFLYIFT